MREAREGGFGSRWFMRLQSRCQSGLQRHLKARLGLEDHFPCGWHTGLASWCWPLAEASAPHDAAVSTGLRECPDVMAAGFVQNERMHRRSGSAIYIPSPRITPSPPPRCTGQTDQTQRTVTGELHTSEALRRPSWRLATPNAFANRNDMLFRRAKNSPVY